MPKLKKGAFLQQDQDYYYITERDSMNKLVCSENTSRQRKRKLRQTDEPLNEIEEIIISLCEEVCLLRKVMWAS